MPGRHRSKGWCTLWTAGTRMDGKLRSTCSSVVCIVKGYLNRLYLARNILETSKNIELSSTAILLNIAIWVWTPSSQLIVKLNFRLLRRSLSPLPHCKPCLIANQVIFAPHWAKRKSTSRVYGNSDTAIKEVNYVWRALCSYWSPRHT